MSYILDALRKAERERQESRIPTLDAAHSGSEATRRRPWLLAAAGALVLSAVVVYGTWAPGRPEPVPEAAPPPASPVASVSGAARAPSPPPLDRAPEAGAPAAGLRPDPSIGAPSSGLESAGPRLRVAPPAPPAEAPRLARAGADVPRTPAPTGNAVAPAAPEPRPAPAKEPPAPPPPAVSGGGAEAERRPPPASPAAAGLPIVAAPFPGAVSGRAAGPAPGETLARLTLDVLVYSDVPAERLVFISGRKYVEGQAVDGDAVVEQITPDGAILRHGDQRIVLRPKLNPYTRPGSP